MEKKQLSEAAPLLEVPKETEHKLVVLTALDCIHDGDLTREEAMDAYQVAEEDLTEYQPLWESLNN